MSSQAKEKESGGLSITTLVIASLSSLAAAIFIHEFWQGGAILGAAITPIIVSLVSELLRRPTDRVSAVVAQRAVPVRRGSAAAARVAPEQTRRTASGDDPFGLRGEQVRRLRRRRLGLGLATGLAAFALAGFLLTSTELVIGNPLGGSDGAASSNGGGGGTTLLGGSSRDDTQERERTQEEQDEPADGGQDAPQDAQTQEEEAPETEAPETTPETTPETPAPEGATPPGEEPQTPAPAPTTPAPTPPAPDPGGTPAP